MVPQQAPDLTSLSRPVCAQGFHSAACAHGLGHQDRWRKGPGAEMGQDPEEMGGRVRAKQ